MTSRLAVIMLCIKMKIPKFIIWLHCIDGRKINIDLKAAVLASDQPY